MLIEHVQTHYIRYNLCIERIIININVKLKLLLLTNRVNNDNVNTRLKLNGYQFSDMSRFILITYFHSDDFSIYECWAAAPVKCFFGIKLHGDWRFVVKPSSFYAKAHARERFGCIILYRSENKWLQRIKKEDDASDMINNVQKREGKRYIRYVTHGLCV